MQRYQVKVIVAVGPPGGPEEDSEFDPVLDYDLYDHNIFDVDTDAQLFTKVLNLALPPLPRMQISVGMGTMDVTRVVLEADPSSPPGVTAFCRLEVAQPDVADASAALRRDGWQPIR